MKRFSFLLATLMLMSVPALRAQDAATEERLNKLSGKIEELLEGQQVLTKSIEKLRKDLETVREEAKQPNSSYASQEDLKSLANTLKDVDRKRIEDYDKIRDQMREQLRKLGQTMAAVQPPTKSVGSTHEKENKEESTTPPKEQKGFEYKVQSGDTLSAIVQAFREQKNLKVTMEQVLKANPGLKAERMRVGQTILIPAP